MEKDRIKIEKVTPVDQKWTGGLTYSKKDIDDKFEKMNYILIGVVLVLIFMVAGFLLDALHFNSAIYREYADKVKSVETTQKINEELLKQIQSLSQQNMDQMEMIKKIFTK